MTDAAREKIGRFLADKMMADAVYQVLLDQFLKATPVSEALTLAAERIAIGNLVDAWRELQRYKRDDEHEPKKVGNMAL